MPAIGWFLVALASVLVEVAITDLAVRYLQGRGERDREQARQWLHKGDKT